MNWKKLLCKISHHRSNGDRMSVRVGAAWDMRGVCERCGCILRVKKDVTIWEEVPRERLIAEELMKDEAARDGHQYDSGGPQGWQGWTPRGAQGPTGHVGCQGVCGSVGVQGNVGNQGPTP
jgi:hypothetical protein